MKNAPSIKTALAICAGAPSALILALSSVTVSAAEPELSASAPEVIYPAYSATTPPLSELAKSAEALTAPQGPPVELSQFNRVIPDRILQATAHLPWGEADEALQEEFTGPNLPAPPFGLNFLGLGKGFPGFLMQGEPPDTEGAVGATQYVQWVNLSFAVFNKTNGAKLLGPIQGNKLFSALPANSICRTTNSGDPIAQYDKFANRWVLTQFAITQFPNGKYAQCIAVSKTNDARGAYNVYQFNFPDLNDYPKLGVWPDGYYVTYNMFDTSTGSFKGAKTCAYERAKMLAGLAPRAVCFNPSPSQAASLLPGDLDGKTLPPAGAPNPQFEMFNKTNIARWSFHVNYATPSLSTYKGVLVPVKAFNFVCNNFAAGTASCVPQKGVTQKLDTLGDRMMYRAAYRRTGTTVKVERVVLTHSVDVGLGRTGVRWYEIRNPNGATPTVFQQSTFPSIDTNHRWMSSAAMDKMGNILLGYSRSGPATFPSVYYTGRQFNDPLNTMRPERLIRTGTGAQVGHDRWGDYSAMTIDPVNDCTFWYTQEYIDAPNGDFIWKTRIANVKFPNCL